MFSNQVISSPLISMHTRQRSRKAVVSFLVMPEKLDMHVVYLFSNSAWIVEKANEAIYFTYVGTFTTRPFTAFFERLVRV
jgi:hypothetical protein